MALREPLLKYWDYIRSSFWFLPSLMAAGAAVLAFAAVAVDRSKASTWLQKLDWAYTGGAEGASAVLQTVAGSMITIAGVVFSLTLVALSLASSQFGPRLLHNFMRDRANQMVLGTFTATFLYCLLVLRTIRYTGENAFVPHLSVTLGVVFALASLWVLIYFIHHVSVSIQADHIIARVAEDLTRGIEQIFPAQIGAENGRPDAGRNDPLDSIEQDGQSVAASGEGYLQLVDAESLLALATEHDVQIRLEMRPGQYVILGHAIATVSPGERVDEAVAKRLNAAFALGRQRTPNQDLEYSILQLVEIATRALSPGVNDPFTAIACVDRLVSGLNRVAQRELPSPHRYDEEGRLRVIVPRTTFAGLVDAALNQIRQHSRGNAAVSIHMLEKIAALAGTTTRIEHRAVLQHHADMIARGARESLPEPEDRRAMEERYAAAVDALRG
jgi:uncharacterized membrane protein